MSVVSAWPEMRPSSVDQLRVKDKPRTCASNPRKKDVPAARHRFQDTLLLFSEFHRTPSRRVTLSVGCSASYCIVLAGPNARTGLRGFDWRPGSGRVHLPGVSAVCVGGGPGLAADLSC